MCLCEWKMQRIPRNLRFFFLFSKSEVDRENVRVKFNDRTRVCVHKVHLAVDFTTTCWFLLTPPPSSGAHRRHLFFPSLSPLSKAREEDKERRRSLVGFVFFFVKRKTKPFLCPIPFSCAKLFHSRKWFGAQLPRWVFFFFNSTTATCFLFHGKFSRLKRRPFLVCTYNLPPTFCVPFVLIFLCVATFFNSGDEIVFFKIIFVWRKQTEWWSCKKSNEIISPP